MRFEQIVARGGEEQDRRVDCAVANVREQVEEGDLCPVDVFDDQQQRRGGRQSLEELARRPVDLGQRKVRGGEAGCRCQALDHVGAADDCLQPGAGLVGRVVFPDIGRLPDHFHERPERDAIAVRQAAAAEEARARGDATDDFVRQPGFADARVADDRHHAGFLSCDDVSVQARYVRQLGNAADHRRIGPPQGPVQTCGGHQAVSGHAL
jgi:hypothetical protein